MKATNKTAGSGVYHPGPNINKAARNHAAGKQPGKDSLMHTDEYQSTLLFKNVKKPSPKTR